MFQQGHSFPVMLRVHQQSPVRGGPAHDNIVESQRFNTCLEADMFEDIFVLEYTLTV